MFNKEFNAKISAEIEKLEKIAIEKGLTAEELADLEKKIWAPKDKVCTAAGDFVEYLKKEIDKIEPKK